MLAEYSLGGWIGQSVKGSSDVLGVFRLAGITVLVLVLAFPLGSRVFSKWAAGKARVSAETTAPIVVRLFRKLGSAGARISA